MLLKWAVQSQVRAF